MLVIIANVFNSTIQQPSGPGGCYLETTTSLFTVRHTRNYVPAFFTCRHRMQIFNWNGNGSFKSLNKKQRLFLAVGFINGPQLSFGIFDKSKFWSGLWQIYYPGVCVMLHYKRQEHPHIFFPWQQY